MTSPTPLRRELLLSFGIVFSGAILLATVGLFIVLPLLETPAETTLFIGFLILGNLVILFVFGRGLLKRALLDPVDQLVGDARRIAEGDYRHRMAGMASRELDALSQSVNAMAERLIKDQTLLSDNVASLEDTNAELISIRNQMVQAARLASVGTLAAGIAHEVGNPLGAVLAYVDVSLSRAKQSGADTELLDAIRSEALRIDRIIRGLLDYARPQSVETHSVAASDVLDRVRDLLESQGQLDHISNEWHLPTSLPEVRIEAARLEQVLINLVLNAIDALKGAEHPWLEVRVSLEQGTGRQRIFRESDPPGANYAHRRRMEEAGRSVDPLTGVAQLVTITVSDNGDGLPEGDEDNVFDPFFTTKAPGEGTGLGLSICAQLVESMGGRIDAANRVGGGAVFTVKLPAETAPPDQKPALKASELER